MRAYTEEKLHWKTFIPGYQTFDLNFRNYDNDSQYYVYDQGNQTGITIVAPEYWPLPWYLRDYNRVGYFGRMSQSNEPIIVATQGQAAEVEAMFGDRYQQVHSGSNPAGTFSLRPGVELMLFTRRELVK
jgi:hypothetical protein